MKNINLFMDKTDAITLVENIVENEAEYNKIFVDENNKCQRYSKTDEEIGILSRVMPFAACTDENGARRIALDAIKLNAFEIAEWLLSNSKAIKVKIKYIDPKNYRINSETGEKTVLDNVLVTLRKELGYKTEYGFFVAGIIPIE